MTQMGQGSLERVTEIVKMLKDVVDVGVRTIDGESKVSSIKCLHSLARDWRGVQGGRYEHECVSEHCISRVGKVIALHTSSFRFVDIESTQFSEVLSGGHAIDLDRFEERLVREYLLISIW